MPDRQFKHLEKQGFERVLDAEQAADLQIASSREQAAALLQAAHATQRRISTRADQRLQKLHHQVNAAIERECAELLRTFEAQRRELAEPPADTVIAAAASRLARRLTGIDSA
jgi:hypothetical protein